MLKEKLKIPGLPISPWLDYAVLSIKTHLQQFPRQLLLTSDQTKLPLMPSLSLCDALLLIIGYNHKNFFLFQRQ